MDASDFEQITGSPLYYNSSSDKSCFNISGSAECGYGNSLIDNGGYYWFATPYSSTSFSMLTWFPNEFRVNSPYSDNAYGLRPVLRLASSVLITGGSGTYKDPYIIGNG